MGHRIAILVTSVLVVLSFNSAQARNQVVVAVIDTGFEQSLRTRAPYLCKTGHKDFTNTTLSDRHGHGTHISGLIDQYVKDFIFTRKNLDINALLDKKANYCQIIIKDYDGRNTSGWDNLQNEIKAFKYAITLHPDIINFSGGGVEFSKEESDVVKEALDAGIRVVVAAGNEGKDIDIKGGQYYPACVDDRVIVVGNHDSNEMPARSSNYGRRVNFWEHGMSVLSLANFSTLSEMSGTSQSAAIYSGKLVREMLQER